MNVSLLRYTANIQHNWLNSCVNWKRLVRLYAKWIDKKLTPEDAHSNKINLLLLLHALPNLDLNKHNALPPEAKIFNKIYHLSVDGANKLVLKVGLSIFDKITRVRDLSSENNFTNNDGDTHKILMATCCGMS